MPRRPSFLPTWHTNRRPSSQRSTRLGIVALEDRVTPAAPFPEFVDPNPSPGNLFGFSINPLSTGNVVVTAPYDDAGGLNAGAAYLFSGKTGALISTLRGSSPNDNIGIGGVTPLANGNYVIQSEDWDNGSVLNAGAMTFGNGITGVSGTVSAANSLVGTNVGDMAQGSVRPLASGNYLVINRFWQNGTVDRAGAITFGNGTTGISGEISAANSFVGSSGDDFIDPTIHELTNGNFLIASTEWNNGAGSVTLANGATGITGTVSAANSLIGGTSTTGFGSNKINGDSVGGRIRLLPNGNYIAGTPGWNNGSSIDVGAVTFGNGSTGVVGFISEANSLIGTTTDDRMGLNIEILANGNFAFGSEFWNNGSIQDVGFVGLGSGTTGISGKASAANGLVGTKANDQVGILIVPLTNGNFVVGSEYWDNGTIVDAGAATFVNGTTGLTGQVSVTNSLVGGTQGDRIGTFNQSTLGGIVPLANGNYVTGSRYWTNGTVAEAGSMTFGNGTTGITGVVSAANSLVGTQKWDMLAPTITALANGNYVVSTTSWNNGTMKSAGAATFGNGTTGVTGTISPSISLVGTSAGDGVGSVTKLADGNYVVRSEGWQNGTFDGAGAVTFGNGITGVSGVVSPTNSLVGSSKDDRVGERVRALSNGAYVVNVPLWDNGTVVDAGASTFGPAGKGITGTITPANSLVGTQPVDRIGDDNASLGSIGVVALKNGNYIVNSFFWNNGSTSRAGAVTFGNGTTGIVGTVTTENSVIGGQAKAGPRLPVVDDVNNTFYVSFLASGFTRIFAGSQVDGFATSPPPPITNEIHTIAAIPDQSSTGGSFGPIALTIIDDDNFAGEVFTVSPPLSSNPSLVPVENIVITGSGLNRAITITPTPGIFGQTEITILVSDGLQLVAEEKFLVSISEGTVPPPPPPPPTSNPFVAPALAAYGADVGGGPRIKAMRSDGTTIFDQFAFESTFTGGVRVAVGDVTGDGTPDILAAAGDGGGPRVQVYDGKSGEKVRDFFAFEPGIRTGAFVASHDLNGDGFAETIVSAGVGGGPRVTVFDGKTGSEMMNFFAFDDTDRGGVTVAAGQLGLIVGEASGSRVRLFDLNGSMTKELTTSMSGVSVASLPDGIAAGSLTGTPRIQIFDDNGLSHDLTPGLGINGVRIASSSNASLIVGINGRVHSLSNLTPANFSDEFLPFDSGFLGGVWVAG